MFAVTTFRCFPKSSSTDSTLHAIDFARVFNQSHYSTIDWSVCWYIHSPFDNLLFIHSHINMCVCASIIIERVETKFQFKCI